MEKIFLLTIMLTLSFSAFSQKKVQGTVKDQNGESMPGVNITEKGTTEGTVTDAEGKFSLEVNENAVLIFSFIGFVDKEVKVGDQPEINIVLIASSKALEEVVVTALGLEESEASLTYSIQTIKPRELNSSRVGDVSKQLSGIVPGVNITANPGSAVSSTRITIRGESSLTIGNNQPLIIVDGTPISNNFNGVIGGNAKNNNPVDYGNGLSDINPDDIEDISVLKGPKAAALYGTRAANGALVIRTKSGKYKEGYGVEFNTGVSFDVLNRWLDEQKIYGGGNPRSLTDEFIFGVNWGASWGPKAEGQLIEQGTPYRPEPGETPFNIQMDRRSFFETGISVNNNLAFAFGNDNTRGRISFSRQDKTSIIPNTNFKRNSLSFHLNNDIADKVNVDFSGNYVNSFSDNLVVTGVGDDGREGIIYCIMWANNNFNLDDFRDYWYTDASGTRKQKWLSTWGTNVFLITHENLNAFNRDRFFGNLKANYELTEDLYAHIRIGADKYRDRRNSRRPAGQPQFPNGMYREQLVDFQEINTDLLITYKKDFDNFGINTNLGGNIMTQSSFNKTTRVDNLSILDVYNFSNAAETPSINELNSKKQTNSLYGSFKVDYNKKVFLELTGRNDWSSTLPTNSNSFFYPSVGLSGIISDMVEMPSIINYLKLRGSWAQTGNDTDPKLISKSYAYGQLPNSVVSQSFIENPDLRPERTTAIELGFDLSLLSERLDLTFNYYNNTSIDQILNAKISPASGAASKLINAGEIKNTGFEVLLMVQPIKINSFRWDVILNWATNSSEIIKLSEGINSFVMATGPALTGVQILAKPGGKMGDIYGAGLAKTPDGQVIWREVRDSGTGGVAATPSTSTELRKIGNYNPDWTSGITNKFRYKNIDLRIFLEYRHGGDLYTETGGRLYQNGVTTSSIPDKGDRSGTFIPEGVMLDANGNYVPNTIPTPYYSYYRQYYRWDRPENNTFDASFIKIREITVGIDLNPYLKNSPFTKFYLSAFGRNVFTYTLSEELRHFDPESFMITGGNLVPGIETGQLPTPTTFGMNLNIGI